MSRTVTVQLPQLALFELDPLPATLPTRAPRPFPKPECPECGRPVKGLVPGTLCAKCIIRRPLPEEARQRVCCRQCPDGECYAIPF